MQFKDIVGQKELKHHLIDEAVSGKISHAQLFLGNPGFGSLPLALAFIQYIFCEKPSKTDSCGICPSCKKVNDLQHPDLHFSFPTVQALSKKSDGFIKEWRQQLTEKPYFKVNDWLKRIDIKERNPIIGTEESLEIIKKLSLKSYEGGYKVMIIWMAELMNPTCSNKLLKILEEPPAKTIFVLVCESMDNMLQTIISRTQTLVVPRIGIDELSQYLRKTKGLSQANADSVAARVDGDLIEATDLLEDQIEQDENREMFIQLMRVCYKKDVIPMMDWGEEMARMTKERQKIFLRYALHMFRQSILKNYTENQLTRVSDEEEGFLQKFARFITGNNILDFMETFNDAHYHIERNANAKILFTNLCFKVMRYIHFA
jgi:DNA polymerase-3 subunit delta'